MLKKLMVLVIALVAGCSGCAHVSGWNDGDDPDAREAQSLMRQTVEVNHQLSTLAPFGEGGKPVDVKGGSAGTGVVVDLYRDESLVVTARHVCAPVETMNVSSPDGVELALPVLGEAFSVWTIDLQKLPAEVAYIDPDDDVCVLRVLGRAGDRAELLGNEPPVGSRVVHVGSPNRVLDRHEAYVSEGRLGGRHLNKTTGATVYVLSVPSDNGSSGGGVYYHGRLFSVVSMVGVSFKSIAYGVTLSAVQRAVMFARKARGR